MAQNSHLQVYINTDLPQMNIYNGELRFLNKYSLHHQPKL